MVRYMYDSVNPAAIPRDAEMVAGYTDGIYKWSQADWDRFPDAVKVRISAIGVDKTAHVVDVEPGCVWPPENAVPWVQAARRNGIDPTVYVNYRNDLWRTRQAFDRAGVPQPHYWVAEYTGWPRDGSVPYIPDGTVGRQFAHPPQLNNQHYDLSVIRDYWPGVDRPQEEDDMYGDADRKRDDRIHEILEVLNSGATGTSAHPDGTGTVLADIAQWAIELRDHLRWLKMWSENANLGATGNPTDPDSVGDVLPNYAAYTAKVRDTIGRLDTAIGEIAKRIDSIAVGGIDEDALADRLAARLAKRLES